MSKGKYKNHFSFLIIVMITFLIILWGIKISITDYEKIKDYSIVCTVYMLSNGEEIKKKIFTNDDWTKKSSLVSYDGKVYNLSKFHYYECEYIKSSNNTDYHFSDRPFPN